MRIAMAALDPKTSISRALMVRSRVLPCRFHRDICLDAFVDLPVMVDHARIGIL